MKARRDREARFAPAVHTTKPREQLEEILARLDLYRSFEPFSRCLRCNGKLEEANRDSLNGRAPGEYDQFWTCRQCDHIYWQGSHWRRMRGFVDELEHAAHV